MEKIVTSFGREVGSKPRMKHGLAIVLLFVLTLYRVHGESETFYVAAQPGILRGSIDSETGALAPLELAIAANDPHFLALSPTRPVLYATFKHSVGSFLIGPDQKITTLGEGDTGGKGTCHVAVDRSGRFVFAADYSSGTLASFAVSANGVVSDRVSLVQLRGSGPNPQRQDHSYAHSVYPDPENHFLYACDLGSDHIWIFKIDAKDGTLTPSDPPSAAVLPGSGPRHLAFGVGGKFVYVVSEMGGTVTVFARDAVTGGLTRIETVSTMPADTTIKDVWSAEIVVHLSGKWLYVSNRRDDTISVFALAPDGKATLIQHEPALVKTPRSFWLDPSGKWLVAAGEGDGRLSVLKVDPSTGKLSPTGQVATVKSPHCVLFDGK